MASLNHNVNAFLVLALAASALTVALAGETRRISVSSDGGEGDGHSTNLAIDRKGRFVAFSSDATNLVAGDTNGVRDIFVHDRRKGTTIRVSVSSAGVEANMSCFSPAISANGRYIAFDSGSTTLVEGDDNGRSDVFLHDRKKGTTTRVSLDSVGNEGDGHSIAASISANGRFIGFDSSAENLVAGDGNGSYDVYVHDRKTGATEHVSVDSAGRGTAGTSSECSISASGRYVAFHSSSSDLVADDLNGERDVFVRDRKTGTTSRVSVGAGGSEGTDDSAMAAISGTGRYVAFQSSAANLTPGDENLVSDVYVHDRKKGLTVMVSVNAAGAEGDAASFDPAISENGRVVAFRSTATNLVPGDGNGVQDIFVHDRKKRTTTRESVASSGAEGDGAASGRALSANGRLLVFDSRATNLVEGDLNGAFDVFVRDRKKRSSASPSKSLNSRDM